MAPPQTATTWCSLPAKGQRAACASPCRASTASITFNPHATSTPIGDVKEIEAIREVFGDKSPPISATKSLTGHSLGAAGVHEAIYSLLMMNNGFICESANIETIDPAVADMPIVRKRQDNVDIDCVMSNSFGFGGTNATLVFRRYNG
jgi:3-oxoacyl-[acyl-carrier-protein] synthase-1